jgi:tetratricopeptide (TPR) repeat protein
MCTLAGIESQVVIGYSRYYNFGSKHPFTWSDHAWNAVKLGGKWYLLDATWEGKRYGENGKQIESRQFLVDPGEFVVDHLPENPMWQLLACPVLLADFTQSAPMIRTILSRKDTCFSFSDSIAAWRGKLLPEQALSSARSAYQFNPLNHSSIGVALGRYGVYLAKNNAGNGKANINFRIGKEQEALHYFTQALQHLRKTRRDDYVHNRKKSINNCKKNIKASKARIKKLRKIKKTAINITLIDNRAASLGLTA